MGRTREREERAEDEREHERIEARRASRVSGRAEVTVRCENSFESSPRLIVEEGRSSTGLLCRSCSPLFPPCSCYPNRKVGIAITIVRSFQPEIRASIYRYLLIGNIFIYGETRSLSATLFLNAFEKFHSLCERLALSKFDSNRVEIVRKKKKKRFRFQFERLAETRLRFASIDRSIDTRIGRFSYRGKTRYEWNRAESNRIGLKENRDIDASPQRTVIISDRMSVCRSAE